MAGVLWIATTLVAFTEVNLKVYLALWLATLLSSLVAVALWMTRPDHGLLSDARFKLATIKLEGAIAEHERSMRDLETSAAGAQVSRKGNRLNVA